MSPRPSGEILGRRLSCAAVDPCRSRGERFDRTRGYNPRVARSRTTYGSNNEANNVERQTRRPRFNFVLRSRGAAASRGMPPPRRPARTPARTPASSSSSSSETHRVHEIATLGRADDATARRLLERCAWHVQPIMRARRWRVATLLEMKPEQRDRVGDNYNRGERVRIKLRNPASDTGWYDLGHVVLVMLHELVHNDIGPHNRAFFKVRADADADDFLTSSSQTRRRPQPPRAHFDSFRFVFDDAWKRCRASHR